MENRRFILMALIGVILFFLYQAWQKDHAPAPLQSAPTEATSAPVVSDDAPQAVTAAPSANAQDAAPVIGEATDKGASLIVQTDLYKAEIAFAGGTLRRLELNDFAVSKDAPQHKLPLFDDSAARWYVLQSGLATPKETLSGPQSIYSSAQAQYRMRDGENTLDVPLTLVDAHGVRVTKVYRFTRGSYQIGLEQTVSNGSSEALAVSPYVRLWRTEPASAAHHAMMMGVNTFTGVGFYERKPDSDKYRFRKLKFEELSKEPLSAQQTGGWMSMMEHYFITAIIPPADEVTTFSGKPSNSKGYFAQMVGTAATIAPQGTHAFSTQIYAGPLLQKTIGSVAPGLEYAVDYGILTPIAEPLFWLLDQFHKLTHNWGFAIILLTLVVKGMMYKLSEAQYRSMAKMKKFAPRITELKERYADDRERMSKAMMELYKKEGFNPLAGCWPLLVQFPVFIALYWVLLESVELRQAPFMLWINDLSAADPYFVLPVLFGISMFVQQKLSGQQMADPLQQKIMSIMPIIMTAFFAFFPAGLVVYWFVSNLVGITQQWIITRKLEREDEAKKAAA